MRLRLVAIATIVIGFAVPALAHHSLAAEYDKAQIATVNGTISEVIWRNPHASITLTVQNADGSTKSFKVEIAPPGALTLKGFDPTILKIGESVTVEAWMPKDQTDTTRGAGRKLTLADGRQFDIADSWMWGPLSEPAPASRR